MKKHVVVLGILFLIFLNVPGIGQNVGSPAPDFTIGLADGGTFTLSEHQGRVVMIFFFGNGCPYCKESGPYVQGIYDEFKNDPDFVAIGLDTWDSSSDAESVAEFASFTGITFSLGIDANFVKTAYGYNYDRLMVIDRDGIIRTKNNTAAVNDIEETTEAIEMYLRIPTSILNIAGNEKKVLVYPLPASDIVNANLYLEYSAEVQFVIYDVTGRVRKRVRMHLEAGSQRIEININALDRGMYFYSVAVGSNVDTGKLLIR